MTRQLPPADHPREVVGGLAKVTRANSTAMHDRFQQRETQFARFNAAENMADFAAIAELNGQLLRRPSAAFETLYASMSPEQKAGADAVFRTGRRPHPGGRA